MSSMKNGQTAYPKEIIHQREALWWRDKLKVKLIFVNKCRLVCLRNRYDEKQLNAKTSDSNITIQLQIHPMGCPSAAPIVMQTCDLPIVFLIATAIHTEQMMQLVATYILVVQLDFYNYLQLVHGDCSTDIMLQFHYCMNYLLTHVSTFSAVHLSCSRPTYSQWVLI